MYIDNIIFLVLSQVISLLFFAKKSYEVNEKLIEELSDDVYGIFRRRS